MSCPSCVPRSVSLPLLSASAGSADPTDLGGRLADSDAESCAGLWDAGGVCLHGHWYGSPSSEGQAESGTDLWPQGTGEEHILGFLCLEPYLLKRLMMRVNCYRLFAHKGLSLNYLHLDKTKAVWLMTHCRSHFFVEVLMIVSSCPLIAADTGALSIGGNFRL